MRLVLARSVQPMSEVRRCPPMGKTTNYKGAVMSSFYKDTFDPASKTERLAFWIDDFFGRHRYGVQFDNDGPVWTPNEIAKAERTHKERSEHG